MKMTLTGKEIGEAIIEYLARRGVDTKLDLIYLDSHYNGKNYVFTAEIREVVLPPKEGPYR